MTRMAIGQLRVIQPKQMKDCGLRVMTRAAVLDRLVAKLVGRSIAKPPRTPPPAIHIVNPSG